MTVDSGIPAYAAYVPTYVVCGLHSPASKQREFPTALLFADISGFTPLARRLDELGAEGAEKLTKMLNAYYGPLVEMISEYGGDIVRFAGDAVLAMWSPENTDLEAAVVHAAQAAIKIQDQLASFRMEAEVQLSLRISLAAGTVCATEVGGAHGSRQLLILGDPLDQIRRADKQSGPGDIVLSAEISELLKPYTMCHPLEAGLSRLVSLHSDEDVSPPVSVDVFREISPEILPELRKYLPPVVLSRFDSGMGDWLAELRRVTAMFVQLPDVETHADPVTAAKETMRILQAVSQPRGGLVFQLLADDKGLTGVIGFGLSRLVGRERTSRARQAIEAAWEIREILSEMGLRANISLSTGSVFCGPLGSPQRREYTIMGSAVNRAARLMQCANNDILCDAETRGEAAEWPGFQSLPNFELKGFPDPVPVSRILNGHKSSVPIIRALGRKQEWADVQDFLSRAREGRHGILIIEGEAGIGKSTLVADLLEHARQLKLPTYLGDSSSGDGPLLYAPWQAILTQWAGLVSLVDAESRTARIAALSTQLAPSIRAVLPLLNPLLKTDFPDSEGIVSQLTGKNRADSLHQLIGALIKSTSQPLPILVLEDVQWMDSGSWHLAWEMYREEVASLVFVTRPNNTEFPKEFLSFYEHPDTKLVELGPLNREASTELLEHHLGISPLPDAVVEFFYERTEGHPFFLEELADYLRETGRLTVAEGRCQLALEIESSNLIPNSVRDVLVGRIDQLQPDQQLTLKVASVIGRIFATGVLKAVHPMPGARDRLTVHLKNLLVNDFIRALTEKTTTDFLFKHAITQQVSYAQLPQEYRERLHCAVAEWYEHCIRPLDRHAATLAHHWGRGGQKDKEIRYLGLAGEFLLNSGAYQEACTAFENALSMLPGEESIRDEEKRDACLQRASWERLLAEARFNLGELEVARQHVQQSLRLFGWALKSSRIALGIRLLCQVGQQFWHRARFRHTREATKKSNGDDALRQVVLASELLAQIEYFRSDLPNGLTASLQALNLAERVNFLAPMARAYANFCIAASLLRCHRTANLYRKLAIRTARSAEHLPSLAYVLSVTSVYQMTCCQWDQVQADGKECVAICERLGDRRRLAEGVCVQALEACFRGRFEESVEHFRRVHEIGQSSGNLLHQAWGLCGEGECQFRLGNWETAEKLLLDANELLQSDEGYNEAIRVHGLLASVRLRQGDFALASTLAQETLDLLDHRVTVTASTLEGLAGATEVFFANWEHRREDGAARRAALSIARHLRHYARTFPVGRPRAERYAGLAAWFLGRPAAATRYWNRSLQSATDLALDMESALTHLEIGRHLPASHPNRRKHLESARHLFIEMQMAAEVVTANSLISQPKVIS